MVHLLGFPLEISSVFKKYPNFSLILSFSSAYLAYYLIWVVKRPKLASGPKFRQFLLEHCPLLKRTFWPTVWCFESRAQTLLRTVIKSRPKISFQRHLLSLKDGGEVAIDWMENDSRSRYPRETRPTVLIMPGLIGSSDENYALHLVNETSRLGYRSVVFNNRGLGGTELKTARTYCATNTEDLTEVIAHVKEKYPQAPLIAAGISLGGLILTHYMAGTGKQCPLVAGMTFSAAYDVYESTTELGRDMINDLIFNRYLSHGLLEAVKRNEDFFRGKVDLEKVYKSRTIREFDDAFTSLQFGYGGYRAYYDAACTHEKLHQVAAPLLCLNAADDPFSPGRALPLDKASTSKAVAIVKTCRGGHIGFLEGIFPRHASYMDRLFAEYVESIFQNLDEVKCISV